ncbi:MAG: hypothetical protein GY847_32020 [Proteobacteria bacterium]|nr:hypothetical protein [Pseudomonadota bacterium]
MKIVAALTDPASIRRYLEGTGQSAEIPTLAPARAPPPALALAWGPFGLGPPPALARSLDHGRVF